MTLVYVYGSGECEQLGLGDEAPNEIKKPRKPVIFDTLPDFPARQIIKIVCGGMHTAALASNGSIYTWGCNDEKALGRPGAENVPLKVEFDFAAEDVSAGDSHTIAYNTQSNQVFYWGCYRNAQSGKTSTKVETPTRIANELFDTASKMKLKKIASGAQHTLALSTCGKVFGWGDAESGKIGRNLKTRNRNEQALKIEKVGAKNAIDIFCGNQHSFYINDKKQLFSWGLNNHGQLGIGNKFDTAVPTRVKDLDPFEDDYVVEVAGGEHHSIARTNDGLVYCWGRNDEGQVGAGDLYGDWRKQKKEKQAIEDEKKRVEKEKAAKEAHEALLAQVTPDSKIQIKIIEGTWTSDADGPSAMYGKQDPFIVIKLHDKEMFKTSVKNEAGKVAEFNEEYSLTNFEEALKSGNQLFLKSYNECNLENQEIGSSKGIRIEDLIDGTQLKTHKFDLFNDKHEKAGSLKIETQFIKNQNEAKEDELIQSNTKTQTKKQNSKKIKEKEPVEEDLKYIFYFYRPQLVENLWKLELAEGDDKNEKRKKCSQVQAAGQYCYAVIEDQKEVYAWGFGENYVLGNREDENEFFPKLLHPKMFEEKQVVMMACGTQHAVALALDGPDAKIPEQNLPKIAEKKEEIIEKQDVQTVEQKNEQNQVVDSQHISNGVESKKRKIDEMEQEIDSNQMNGDESNPKFIQTIQENVKKMKLEKKEKEEEEQNKVQEQEQNGINDQIE